MKDNQTKKYYWGIGLENETYMQFEESLIVSGEFIQEKIGFEKYSIDYRKCYKPESLAPILKKAFDANENYTVSRMMNSHSLEKLDINYQHKTISPVKPLIDTETGEVSAQPTENPEYLGKSIMELFLEDQPYNIQSMITQRNKTMGSVHFDGDSIEFVTKYFENRTIAESCKELKATKKLFLDKINESSVLNGKLNFPDYNNGLNMFMTNQENLVLFNNGTYHFHITLPSLTEDSRIVDYNEFERTHANAIYLLQWFEPFFIATLGSPDIMGVISDTYSLDKKFTLGSMRNAMSRYIGVGTYNKAMPKGKILTYNVDNFRKLLKFEKEENIWWRDQIEADMEYEMLSEVGLDFNQEKMYQSGFEFRSFDEFPAEYLNDVLFAIILICEHSLNLPDVQWGHDSKAWNNLVFKTLKMGYATEINTEEKNEVLALLQLLNPSDANYETLKSEFDAIVLLDEFFFKILAVLHEMYKDNNICLDAMYGQKTSVPPTWNNFNKYQTERHLKQIGAFCEN
ncbi:hypothetical protein [Flavobacterium bizetiae]|uniref:Glutamate--cysteine ligase n=1 Tax=Flavobacterium bizetiae TaxID=2704140 RepID=A0A6J4G7Y5_9FLAO|nr:hypothetical protein [Flavobacterium bizetiae]CAA9195233.1 hypothetical protein FLA105534_00535 [Flavobacterium bizetiae]CAD5343138.1 hypothetical protein FLA105535_03136 [Flavobacterium bizetiae]CAD5346643.1 hypothetical protein FLA105534_00586 [Flavobacterium bizetiae]